MSAKSVLAVHDIACHGRCSLTVILPLISALGIKTSVLPTAVLSTHTGGYSRPEISKTNNFVKNTLSHWNRERVKFDCIYSGYFTEKEEISVFSSAIDLIKKENTLLIVDPVLGDNGKIYNGLNGEFSKEMLELCCKADIIVPNITEACLLTDTPCDFDNFSKDKAQEVLKKLYNITKSKIVLTGLSFEEKIANVIFDGQHFEYVYREKLNCSFHGTGDIFASVLTAALVLGKDLSEGVNMASDFVLKCVERTIRSKTQVREGVEFEKEIPYLLKLFKII